METSTREGVTLATVRNSLLSRVAVQSMHWAVSVWPETSREWGMAVLGEMGEIAEPRAALRWAAGGIMLFLRAVLAQFLEWMKLPVGRGFSGTALPSAGNEPQFPKHSRLATAVVLLAVVAVLFLPSAREAARTVQASWSGFLPSKSDRQELEEIAAKAEKEQDARTLAFVALTYPDLDRATHDRAMHFADAAVALDPSLLWIYGSRYTSCCNRDRAQTAERLKRLKGYDPDNAAVYLANASVEGEPLVEKADRASGTAWKPRVEVLASDRQWIKDMEGAFRAPKYDSYIQRRQELTQEGWKKAPELPLGAIAMGLWSYSLPEALQTQTYAELQVRDALQTGAAGNVKDAESMLAEVTGLGQRMMAGEATPFGQLVGVGLMKRGLEGYEKLYRANGRMSEADDVAAQLSQVEAAANARIHSYIGQREGIVRALRWKAEALEAAAILSLLLAMAIGLSLLVLEISTALGRRGAGWPRRVICRLVDYGPAALLLTSLIFLWSFHPIARIFEQYRAGELNQPEALGLFWEFFTLGSASPAVYLREPYHRWQLATMGLVGIAVFVAVRGLLRQRTTAAGR